jgi:hypothetical protein
VKFKPIIHDTVLISGWPPTYRTNNQLRSDRWVTRHNAGTQYTRGWRYRRNCQISQSSCNCGGSDVRSGFALKFQGSRNVIVKTWKLSQWDNEVNRLYSNRRKHHYICVRTTIPNISHQSRAVTRGRRNSLHHNLGRHLAELGNCYSVLIRTKPLPFHHNDDLMAIPSEFARVLHREGISMIRARISCIVILLHSSCKTFLS